MHERIFAVRDPGSVIEYVGWTATARCGLREGGPGRLVAGKTHEAAGKRSVYFAGDGAVEATVLDFNSMQSGEQHSGPAIIESPFTTVIADGATTFERTASGSLLMRP